MKKILFMLMFGLLIISLVNAYTIKNPCFNNGAYCSSSATCNITIFNPNDAVIVDNKPMTNNLTFFEYNINQSINLSSGTYKVQQVCLDGGLNGSEIFYFKINQNKNLFSWDFESTSGIIFFIIFLIIAVLVMLFIHWELGCLLLLIAGVIYIANSPNIFIGIILVIVSIILAVFSPKK